VIALTILSGGQPAGGQTQSSANSRSPHGSLSIPCQNCHTLSGWKPIRSVPEFDHNTTKYPLRGMHVGVSCTQCHTKPVFTNVGKLCADCHADIHKGQMGASCDQCHNVKGWHVALQQINQHLNRFPLIGAHATLDCDSCHTGAAVGQFQGLSTACYSCHQKDYLNTRSSGLNHVALNLPTTCEQCHSMDNWFGAKFDHLRFTGFALTGAHATLDCAACHAGGKFANTPAACVGCHLADFNKTNNPPHGQAGFPTTCQTCHNTSAWDPTTFNHNTFTSFPLTGAHVNVGCNQCHIKGQFVGTPADCASCHIKDFNSATNPNHVQSGFPTTCQQCHNTTSWTTSAFDHSTTGFPLTGAHTTLQCTQCHNSAFGNYNITSGACALCHMTDYNGTTNPPHQTAGFPTTCNTCHSTVAGWGGATFNHTTTGFGLTGAHTTLQCAQCHNSNFGNYNITSGACALCHMTDYNNTTNPNHKAAGFPTTCDMCHSTVAGWGGATTNFNHAATGFPLTGAHTTLQCTQCHNSNFGNYNITSGACALCHMTDYNGTTNPPHQAAGFPTTCDTCHSTVAGWGGATFNHTTTGFALTGAHTTLQCTQCHNSTFGNYNITSGACALCHMTDYNGTTNPPHQAAGFPTTCDTCHTTVAGWGGATFNHTTTGFALTGAHTTLQCTQCHNSTFGNYNITSGACALCHMTDYNGTTNPNHKAAGFPTTCDSCHTTVAGWGGATFNHNTTTFPLLGPHASTAVTCVMCHVNNNYTTLPTVCSGCHMTDYNNTTNPNHKSAGFPTTCDTCHTTWQTTNWAGATFNHTWFNMNHHGANGVCATCHTNPSDYSVFQCTGCHGNNNPANFQHPNVGGYVYNSVNCYQCHPRG